MNRKTFLILALACLASLLLLASCNKGGDTTDTTSSDTAKETEAVTAIPRYDYMEAEVAPDVEIDRADYVGITLTIPNSYKIEDDDVQSYILSGIRFSYRTAVNGTAMVKDQALKLGDDAYIYYKALSRRKPSLPTRNPSAFTERCLPISWMEKSLIYAMPFPKRTRFTAICFRRTP